MNDDDHPDHAANCSAVVVSHVASSNNYSGRTGTDSSQDSDKKASYATTRRGGCFGNHQNYSVDPGSYHSCSVSDHYNHVTIEECSDWISVEEGNLAWRNSAGDLSTTEGEERSFLASRDEKHHLCEN